MDQNKFKPKNPDMNKFLLIMVLATLAIAGCKNEEKSDNPFFNKYETPFEVPPFEQDKSCSFHACLSKGV